MAAMDGELYEKLFALQGLLQRWHLLRQAERGPAGDHTRGQGRVLALLRTRPDISTRDLARLLGIRQQSLNELLTKLERGGYVRRAPSPADRRVMLVGLTEEGREAQREAPDYGGLFDSLSRAEQAAFGQTLDRVIAGLEARLGAGRFGPSEGGPEPAEVQERPEESPPEEHHWLDRD